MKARAADRKRKRGEALVALVMRRRARIVEDFYDIGEALREILRDELYAVLGYESFEALLEDRDLLSLSQAKKLIAVVENVPREEALALGHERAYALVSYAAATPEPDTVAKLVESKAAIAATSLRDIEAAARNARRKTASDKPSTPRQRERAKREKNALATVRSLLRSAGIARPKLDVRGEAVTVTLSFALLERLAGK